MSAAAQAPLDTRPPLKHLEWEAITYIDGQMGNALDLARAAISKRAKVEQRVVAEWVKSGSLFQRTETVPAGVNPRDGLPLYETRRWCVTYLVAVTKSAPPGKWVRLSSSSGPAAVEVATVEKGRVVKVEQYHQEDYRSVAIGKAMAALEEVGGG
jgi:hypothetical protein